MLPEKLLKSVDRSLLIDQLSDIALILDSQGTVLEANINLNGSRFSSRDWVGKQFFDIVTSESEEKVRALIAESATNTPHSITWRQVNHPVKGGSIDHPVKYCLVPLGKSNKILGMGQDLMPVAALQQQLIEAQQAAERDYWRLRQTEARFRILFEASSEPIFVVDANTRKIMETNPAAQKLLPEKPKISGRTLVSIFDKAASATIEKTLYQAEISGQADGQKVALAGRQSSAGVSVTLLRQGNIATFFVRLVLPTANSVDQSANDEEQENALAFIDTMPDGVVIIDDRGEIIYANPAFAELCQLPSPDTAMGANLGSWLGRSALDLNVLLANLRKNGSIRAYATQLTGQQGVSAEIEISASRLQDDALFGLAIRDAGHRSSSASTPDGSGSMRSNEELADLVGRVPLKELVRESADQIERLSIESALRLTGGNRAAAAEMLGLSRQSLYFKLRRFGFGGLSE